MLLSKKRRKAKTINMSLPGNAEGESKKSNIIKAKGYSKVLLPGKYYKRKSQNAVTGKKP